MRQIPKLPEGSDSYSSDCASNAGHHLAAEREEADKESLVAAQVNGIVGWLMRRNNTLLGQVS